MPIKIPNYQTGCIEVMPANVATSSDITCITHYNVYYVSMGAPSLTMLLRALSPETSKSFAENYPDEVVYINLGFDYDEVSRTATAIRNLCSANMIKFTEIEPSDYRLRSLDYLMLRHKQKKFTNPKDTMSLQHQGWLSRKQQGYGWCGGRIKFGTQLKKSLIKAHRKALLEDLNQRSPYGHPVINSYVGLTSTETHRIQSAFDKNSDKSPTKYPLIEASLNKSDCILWLKSEEQEELPVEAMPILKLYELGLTHIGCWCCRNHNIREIQTIRNHLPDVYEKLNLLEYKMKEPYYRSPKGWALLDNVFWNNTKFIKIEEYKGIDYE